MYTDSIHMLYIMVLLWYVSLNPYKHDFWYKHKVVVFFFILVIPISHYICMLLGIYTKVAKCSDL